MVSLPHSPEADIQKRNHQDAPAVACGVFISFRRSQQP